MMTKKITITISFIMIAFFSFGQTTESEQRTEAKKEARVEASKTKVKQDINDGYMGKKQILLRKLTVSEIPVDFPKYEKTMAKEEYILLVKEWSKKNKHLIKEEFRKELDK